MTVYISTTEQNHLTLFLGRPLYQIMEQNLEPLHPGAQSEAKISLKKEMAAALLIRGW